MDRDTFSSQSRYHPPKKRNTASYQNPTSRLTHPQITPEQTREKTPIIRRLAKLRLSILTKPSFHPARDKVDHDSPIAHRLIGTYRYDTCMYLWPYSPHRRCHRLGQGQPLTDPSPDTIPHICSPFPVLVTSCQPPFSFTEVPFFFFWTVYQHELNPYITLKRNSLKSPCLTSISTFGYIRPDLVYPISFSWFFKYYSFYHLCNCLIVPLPSTRNSPSLSLTHSLSFCRHGVPVPFCKKLWGIRMDPFSMSHDHMDPFLTIQTCPGIPLSGSVGRNVCPGPYGCVVFNDCIVEVIDHFRVFVHDVKMIQLSRSLV